MNKTKFLFLGVLILSTLFSCDYTPPINKKIIEAQKYIESRQYKKSVVLYEEILDRNPNKELRLKISYQLGELYSIYLGQYKKAVKYYEEAKSLTQDPIWLIKIEEKLGETNFSYLKNYAEAIENYKRLSGFTPRLKDYDLYEFRTAISYYYLRKYDYAIELLTNIQKNPGHEFFNQSFYYLGLLYFDRKDFAKALFVWNEYIKREQKPEKLAQAKFFIANIYEVTEHYTEAYDIYYSILNDYPNPDIVQMRLNSLYNRKKARRR